VSYAKANPGKINRGSPGEAILTNLAPLSFEKTQGFSTTHVPFNGDAPAVQALLGGQIDIHGTSITGRCQLIQAGKLRVLGVMDSKRLPQVPDAPTFKEQGYDIEAVLWYSLSVPAGTPGRCRSDRLNKAVNQVIADPDFVTRARAIGMEPRGGTPEELAKFVPTEFERWVPMLQEPEPAQAVALRRDGRRAAPRISATAAPARCTRPRRASGSPVLPLEVRRSARAPRRVAVRRRG
jgi:tripartite-type tricarboxylate transporter receptor subunit TctC